MGMQFGRLPSFLGNGRQVEWESEALEFCPRPFLMKRFSRNEAFSRNVGEWAEWDNGNAILLLNKMEL
ncbi:hypothetical protein [Mesonia oceanica]|uniref:hypothetical protein n=1 Tax=Mesonia oceanica TaxID=2687242 RepID=UPI0012426F88|nr:hypothetical protein [Mesonia oceanica]|tara:strand:- start:953 stop:1156 length:204 start_codon:yes stop_codon:yes gene_type:complete